MVECGVQAFVFVYVIIHWVCGMQVKVLLWNLLHATQRISRERRTKGEVVDDVADVGHRGVQVVVLAPRLDVKVARHPIHQQKSGHKAAGVIVALQLESL